MSEAPSGKKGLSLTMAPRLRGRSVECTEKRKARFIQGDGRRPVRNLPMTARENYGYFFPKTGLSVRFKILSIWVAAPR